MPSPKRCRGSDEKGRKGRFARSLSILSAYSPLFSPPLASPRCAKQRPLSQIEIAILSRGNGPVRHAGKRGNKARENAMCGNLCCAPLPCPPLSIRDILYLYADKKHWFQPFSTNWIKARLLFPCHIHQLCSLVYVLCKCWLHLPRLDEVAKFINAVSAKIYELSAVFFVLPRRSVRCATARACIER